MSNNNNVVRVFNDDNNVVYEQEIGKDGEICYIVKGRYIKKDSHSYFDMFTGFYRYNKLHKRIMSLKRVKDFSEEDIKKYYLY